MTLGSKQLAKYSVSLYLLVCSSLGFAQTPEQQLYQALTAIQSQQLNKALGQLNKLVTRKPDFKLAQLIYADVLQAKARGLQNVGQLLKNNQQLLDFLSEARARWNSLKNPVDENLLPASLLSLDQAYQYAVVVELNRSRLYLFENVNGVPQQVENFYVSMGKSGPYKQFEGDNRTPLGVYFIENFLSPDNLPDKYGRYLQLRRTPFVISDRVNWVSREQWQQKKQYFTTVFSNWLNDWQSLDSERYIQHYSQTFKAGNKNFQQWASHKTRVNQSKKFIRVTTDDLSMLKHPKDDVLVVTFRQHYKSNNYSSVSYKRQYWKQEDDGQWRIIFEGRVREPDQVLTQL